jgi:hypothetical protein
MSVLSTRTLAALAFERGEEFDPAVTLPSGPLPDELAQFAGARPVAYALSATERRRRERARRIVGDRERSGSPLANGAAEPTETPWAR